MSPWPYSAKAGYTAYTCHVAHDRRQLTLACLGFTVVYLVDTVQGNYTIDTWKVLIAMMQNLRHKERPALSISAH